MNKTLHILHADDDLEDRWIFQEGVEHFDPGARLTQFEDGAQLLQYVRSRRPDPEVAYAIVCDMQMPLTGGLDVLTGVKGLAGWQEAPVVILSTSSLTEHVHACLHQGALAFYTKPDTFLESRKVIGEILSRCKKHVAAVSLQPG